MGLSLLVPASAQDARGAGNRLRADLGARGLRDDLGGTVRLEVRLGGSRIGSLLLRTTLVERDGVPIYRLTDNFEVDLPRLGPARMLVRADLRADLSALEVVLETEEARGGAVPSTERVTLRREEGRWVRSVVRNMGAPTHTYLDVPADVLVLTPPLGAGERFLRLVPPDLGRRYSVQALDLETGLATSWKLSVDDRMEVTVSDDQVAALRMVRREGPASLEVLRSPQVGSHPLRIRSSRQPARLVFLAPGLVVPADAAGAAVEAGQVSASVAIKTVRTFLRAVAAGDRATVAACLDLDALHSFAGGAASDLDARRRFEEVLLARLADPDWLESAGLALTAGAAGPGDFDARSEGKRMRVLPKGADLAFVLEQRAGAWRIVQLPSAP